MGETTFFNPNTKKLIFRKPVKKHPELSKTYFVVYELHLPGINSWVATATLLCSKGDNSEEIPGLRVVEIGRLLLSVDYVPHVQGTSRVTLGNNDKENVFD